WFLGRRIVEKLHRRGDEVLLVHRGRSTPPDWVPVAHLHTDRSRLAAHADTVRNFAADAVVDTCALTGADVDAVLPALPEVPTVVLASQEVYLEHTAPHNGRELSSAPLED